MKLGKESIINNDLFNNKQVIEIINDNKRNIFQLLKKGYEFDDEVLSLAGIKKNIKNVKTRNQIVEHDKDTKTYEIDKTPLHKILKEISTIDSYSMTDKLIKEIDDNEMSEDDEIDDSEIINLENDGEL